MDEGPGLMAPRLRVLGNRILVKPDLDRNAPEQLESGLLVAKSLTAALTNSDPIPSLTRGTVLTLGQRQHPLQEISIDLARRLEQSTQSWPDDLLRDAARLLRDLVRCEQAVKLGDDVLLSADSGYEVTMDNDSYIIVDEPDILAVVTND